MLHLLCLVTTTKNYIPKWFTGFLSEFFKVSTYKIFSWWLVTSEEQKALTTNFSGWLLDSDLCCVF